MLAVTWEWIAIYEPALDLANTVAIEKGVPHDLVAPDGEYERWAAAAATAVDPELRQALVEGRARLLALRERIRSVLGATAAGERPPAAAVAALNEASAAVPSWVELDGGQLRQREQGSAVDRLLALYARSALELAAEGDRRLRVCGAPSCGMYYRPNRRQQRWCSVPCGTRARVARHYEAHRAR